MKNQAISFDGKPNLDQRIQISSSEASDLLRFLDNPRVVHVCQRFLQMRSVV